MSQIRKAHSVEILDRRLRDCEAVSTCDIMELVGIHDELARVERKWLANATTIKEKRPASRPLADAAQLNHRFDRLKRLVDAAARRQTFSETDQAWLAKVVAALQHRTPLPTKSAL